MKKLEKQDELIIQNKIDGILSVKEEERFNELIRTSSEARRLYQSPLSLHLSMRQDSNKIPPINLSPGIMNAVKRKQLNKNRTKSGILSYLLRYAAILSAFTIGFAIGMSIQSPRIEDHQVSGTVGKVNNYRNTKATEADIRLKDELLGDSAMVKHVINYMNFFYVRAVAFGKNIDFAIKEVNAIGAFKAKNKAKIDALEKYGKFLQSARRDILLAVAACQSAENTDPELLRNSIIRANNLIAQMNYRNNVVIDFIAALDAFIQEAGAAKYPRLNKAHDLLTCNEISTSIVLKDQVLLKYFGKKKLYGKDLNSPGKIDYQDAITKDMETLRSLDAEKLSSFDFENLGEAAADAEKLGNAAMDAEKLGFLFNDSEELSNLTAFDSEQLGSGLWDNEKLQLIIGY